MSFDTEVVKPGRGRCFRVDISLDGFSTIAYRYSDVPGALDGTNEYDPRVLSLGPVRRAFGQQRIAASSSTSLKMANADGGLDWICGCENIADAAAARFRIYVVLYDKAADPFVFTAKLLGEFVLSSWPAHDNVAVSLSLADDFMGKLGAGLLLPTLLDWQAVGDSSDNPIANDIGLPSSIGINTPIQLGFGEDVMLAFPTIIPFGNNGNGEPYEERIIVPLYCTTDLSPVDQALVSQVIIEAYSFNENQPGTQFLTINREFYPPDWVAQGVTPAATWLVEKSPTITKGGIDYQIVYLVVREDLGIFRFQNIDLTLDTSTDAVDAANLAESSWLRTFAYANGYPVEAVDSTQQYPYVASRVTKWYVRGAPKSQITNAPVPNGFGQSHAIDVLTDLVSVYSSAAVDSASAARVKAGSPFTACSGVVQPWTERANNPSVPPPPLSLRAVLTELAQSSDFDIFLNWDGEIAFSSDVYDFTTATQSGSIVEIFEEELHSGVMRWVPSDGERHAPFNRVYFEGGKPDPTTRQDIPFQGPFDVPDADISPTVRSIEVGLRQGWRPFRQQALDPVQWRSLDGVCRDRAQFSMNLGGLRLELGAYFKLTWTRGTLAGPYAATTFQCESIAYSPDGDVVEIEGVLREDSVTEHQYLLDDESLLVRTKNDVDGIVLEDGYAGAQANDSTVDFVVMGVAVGDILVVRDATQDADDFTRNRAVRISSVAQYVLALDTADTDWGFPTSGVVENADWSIVRGATTYHTAVSDPTNYPSGGDMYGKVTAADGTTSDSETGNRLISG